VDKGKADAGLLRGYLEDEHSGAHAEQAFFLQTLPDYDPAVKYTITWYVHYRSKVLEHLLIQGFFFIFTIFSIVE
jgi:hypothetical protein